MLTLQVTTLLSYNILTDVYTNKVKFIAYNSFLVSFSMFYMLLFAKTLQFACCCLLPLHSKTSIFIIHRMFILAGPCCEFV